MVTGAAEAILAKKGEPTVAAAPATATFFRKLRRPSRLVDSLFLFTLSSCVLRCHPWGVIETAPTYRLLPTAAAAGAKPFQVDHLLLTPLKKVNIFF
jgi:hypothetical protein